MVRIHADGVDDDGSVFLVMELLEGATVRALQNRAGGRLEPALVLRIADQVLDVLAVAHASGVTHRDIKPENLFVTNEGRLKVLDFGLAHMRDSVPGMTLRTLPGALLGTPQFMAPEQLLSCGEIDARSDLFALGATLFALLSGEPVRATRTYEPALQRETIFAARTLRSVWPAAPEAVAAVIDRALRFEPDARWSNARDMQRALRAAQRSAVAHADATADAMIPGAGQPHGDRRSDPTIMLATGLHPPSASARWYALAIVAALLALVVGLLLATQGRRPLAIPAAPRPTIAEPAPAPAAAPDPMRTAPAPAPAPAAAAVQPAHDALPSGVSEPGATDAPAATPPHGAVAPKSKRLVGRRRYDRVANDIVDPWE
jgi:serine/threonine-protein kinase